MSDHYKNRNESEGGDIEPQSSHAKNLHKKRQQLLREMQSPEGQQAISISEQLERLDNKGASSSSVEEELWGAKKRRGQENPWMLWVIIGLIIPIILVGIMFLTNDSKRRSNESVLPFQVASGAEKVEPEDWFIKNSNSAFVSAFEYLKILNEDELTLEKIESFVRTKEQAQRIVKLKEAGDWVKFDTRDSDKIKWDFGASGEVPYIALNGLRKDFHKFRAYFVRIDEKLLFDLDATQALGERVIAELPKQELKESVLLRCWIKKEPSFDARGDEELFSWYQILDSNEFDFIWAYCKQGESLDKKLRDKLNYGKLIGERKEKFRAMIQIGNAKEFRDDEFLLESLLAEEWVAPQLEE